MGEVRGTRRGPGSFLSKVIISKIRENELGCLDDISSGPCRRPRLMEQVMTVQSVSTQNGVSLQACMASGGQCPQPESAGLTAGPRGLGHNQTT